MDFLNNVFEQRDKPISDSSKKLYVRNLMKLNNDMPITNFNFLKEPKQILNMIIQYKKNHSTFIYYSNMYSIKEFKTTKFI